MSIFLPICRLAAKLVGNSGRSLVLLAALGLPGLAQAQTVTFPRNASFTGTDQSNFKLGGSAFLTATGSSATNGTPSGTPIDASGSGTLRLTNVTGYQAGYAIDNTTFATPNGFSISFEFFSYGTTSTNPADGFGIFLVDGAGTDPATQFTIGGVGGSLGYAPNTATTPTSAGATNGYIGIGLDEFGNYSNPTEGRTGGPGQVANVVALRGNASGNYTYLTGTSTGTTSTLGTTLSVGGTTRVTTPTNTNYRKAYINVVPVTTNGSTIYKITVRIQSGTGVVTAINSYTVNNPPPTLRIGFSASTGGSNAIHEIRGLAIVQAPIAVDDNAQTPYNKPITINILNNDINGGGANINPATVDLNPNTIGQETSFTVAGQGTFTVDNNGVVTFTPVGNFSGNVSIPYTVQNLNGDISNLGNINVIVTGADVETVVSGPTQVNPGTKTSYSVTTTNNGRETATNVIPTLTLPTGFTLNGALPAGTTSSVSGGVTTVSFAQTTLIAGQSNTASVNVQAPGTSGNVSLASGYAYPSGGFIPDIVPGNNTSTLIVTVTGSTNIAAVCAVPGKDGPITALTTGPNTYYAGTATANAGSTSISVATPTGNTAALIAKGDLLLVMQMQGATINTANTTAYGTVTGTPTAGAYEYAVAAGPVAGGSLPLAGALAKTYTANSSGNTFQVIRIPQYSSLALSGTVTAPAWNGATGGVLALEVAGATDFTNGTLNMDGKGFRGGAGRVTVVGTNSDYVVAQTATQHGSKGEGVAGTPYQVYSGGAAVGGGTTTYENYAVGSFARGQAATGGGGGTIGSSLTNQAGGGGGSNGNTGGAGVGVATGANGARAFGGDGGLVNSSVTGTALYLGGGGGAGSTTDATNALLSSGGTGGGIIILRSGTITGTASGTNAVSASGTAGQTPGTTSTLAAAGGGGAGGTVILNASSGLGNITVRAQGGAGGASTRNGGGGSGGLVFSNTAINAASSVTAGANGTGAAAGSSTTGITIGNNCTPALTTALSTTTPTIARSSNMQTSYVYTVSNTGGGIMGLTASPSLAAINGASGLFTYASMTSAVVQYTDGTSQTLTSGTDYTVTNSGTSAPTFTLASSLLIPSGASVVFTFVANIANTAVVGTTYGSNAATSYLNPQRTIATATTTANAPAYASSNGTSADVVTIVTPLPVKLTKFTVVAAGADAILNWETAQETNNRYFEVERSLDGQTFASVGTVAGNGTTLLASTYRYTDAGAALRTADVLYYRLRQVDLDGQASFSPVRTVQFGHTGASVALYPNPTTSSATLDLSQLPAGDYTVQVFETTGRQVQRGTYQPGKQTLSLETLPTGTYFVKVQGASLTKVLPLIKQ